MLISWFSCSFVGLVKILAKYENRGFHYLMCHKIGRRVAFRVLLEDGGVVEERGGGVLELFAVQVVDDIIEGIVSVVGHADAVVLLVVVFALLWVI